MKRCTFSQHYACQKHCPAYSRGISSTQTDDTVQTKHSHCTERHRGRRTHNCPWPRAGGEEGQKDPSKAAPGHGQMPPHTHSHTQEEAGGHLAQPQARTKYKVLGAPCFRKGALCWKVETSWSLGFCSHGAPDTEAEKCTQRGRHLPGHTQIPLF